MIGRERRIPALLHLSIVLLLLLSAAACARPPVTGPHDAVRLVSWARAGMPVDDLDFREFGTAARRSLNYYQTIPAQTEFILGPLRLTTADMAASLDGLLAIVEDETVTPDRKSALIRERFQLYRAAGADGRGTMLVTGYYEPMISCSPTKDGVFRYPLYRRPDDIIEVDLLLFGNGFPKNRLFGRLEGRKLVPYYTREEIEKQKALAGRNLEILWCADQVEIFLLQVQGSGRADVMGGDVVGVLYDGQNGHPYRSIGRHLIDIGAIPREHMSMQAIRQYFRDNPDAIESVLHLNPSFVFFRLDPGPALGSINVPVTPGRTIATDSSLFPKGAPALLRTEKPVIGEDGEISAWAPFSRFVLNQDTGGAIRGAGRVDLFWGDGAEAETSAGYMQQPGELYFLIKKP